MQRGTQRFERHAQVLDRQHERGGAPHQQEKNAIKVVGFGQQEQDDQKENIENFQTDLCGVAHLRVFDHHHVVQFPHRDRRGDQHRHDAGARVVPQEEQRTDRRRAVNQNGCQNVVDIFVVRADARFLFEIRVGLMHPQTQKQRRQLHVVVDDRRGAAKLFAQITGVDHGVNKADEHGKHLGQHRKAVGVIGDFFEKILFQICFILGFQVHGR